MRLPLIIATVTSAAVLAVVGCSAKPKSVRPVDQSVLPAQAKSLLVNDAQITRVEEERYAKGTVMYRIYYTVDGGKEQSMMYNTKMQTTPTGVFEEPIR
jgi:uncharacterized protein YcfL